MGANIGGPRVTLTYSRGATLAACAIRQGPSHQKKPSLSGL